MPKQLNLKFDIGEECWFLHDSSLVCAKVTAVIFALGYKEDYYKEPNYQTSLAHQRDQQSIGKGEVRYVHVPESKAFPTKQELIASL